MSSIIALSLVCSSLVSASRIDPAFETNITVYHVNPKPFGAVPLNMDTGDAAGDLFFDLMLVYLEPLDCPHGAQSGHGCSNPEVVSPDLVVNKLVLTIDNRYSDYAKCNIGFNNSDGHGNPCKDNTYCCFCESPTDPYGPGIPCNATVGRENVTGHFGSYIHSNRSHCIPGAPDYECWREHIINKFTPAQPGWWYSSQESGYCPDHPTSSTNCTWQADVIKIVNKTCHDASLWGAVQAYDTSGCFATCGAALNVTDPCYLRCFYTTVLGPNADKPCLPGQPCVTGMPLDDLLTAWDRPFVSEDPTLGGCPALPGPTKGNDKTTTPVATE
eukprot:m.77569 g.77569  ORF g.77569 m.77569 type:complete len:329 (+) comp25027_c0_seq1:92-1078(+)